MRPALATALVLCLAAAATAQDASPRPLTPLSKPDEQQTLAKPAKPKASKPPIYDEAADARKVIDAALAKAKAENRRVLIQWGANWCGWCHLLHELCASDKGIARELMYEYDVVLVDVGHFDKQMDLAAGYGAELKKTGIPYLTVLAADGKVLANQDTGPLELKGAETPGHDREKVLAFLKKNEAAPLQASAVLADARDRARAEGKMVLVRWGAPWCGWCHKMDDWLARPEVAGLIAKDYISLKIDQDRMPGGKELLARYRGSEKGGIPWFGMMDPATEKLVVTSDGPKGNIGFPAEPEEIKHFLGMVRQTARRLSPEDIDRLAATLQPVKPADGEGGSGGGSH